MLTERKCLCSAELCTLLLDASKPTFASVGMILVGHLDIALGKASEFVIHEKRTVASIENVDFWICEIRISVRIASTVFLTNVLRPAFSQYQ